MKFPKTGSQADRMLRLIHKHGSLTKAEIMRGVFGMGDTNYFHTKNFYDLVAKDGRISLPPLLARHFDQISRQPTEKYQGQPAEPRVRVFRPLIGYGASLRAAAARRPGCELRDVSFMTCSVSLNPWKVNQ